MKQIVVIALLLIMGTVSIGYPEEIRKDEKTIIPKLVICPERALAQKWSTKMYDTNVPERENSENAAVIKWRLNNSMVVLLGSEVQRPALIAVVLQKQKEGK